MHLSMQVEDSEGVSVIMGKAELGGGCTEPNVSFEVHNQSVQVSAS